MAFSPVSVSVSICQNEKTAIAGGFLGFGLALLFARLPLLHRLEAGIAKVEIKVKTCNGHFQVAFSGKSGQ
jgi:hypothetical protein